MNRLKAAAVCILLAGVAFADVMWPGDCRVQVRDLGGEEDWFAFRDVKSCEAGEHRGELVIVHHDGQKSVRWLDGTIVKLQHKPMPKQERP